MYCEFRGGDGNNWNEEMRAKALDAEAAQPEATNHRSRSPRRRKAWQEWKRYVYTFGTHQCGNWNTQGKHIFDKNPRLEDSKICFDTSELLGSDYEQSLEHSWKKDGRCEEVQAQLKQKPEFDTYARKVQAFLLNPNSSDTLVVTSDWGHFLAVAVVEYAVEDIKNLGDAIANLDVKVCHIELETDDNKKQKAMQWLQICPVP